jgi:lipoprotein-anchoring transpeptidase ErfK/SrfK
LQIATKLATQAFFQLAGEDMNRRGLLAGLFGVMATTALVAVPAAEAATVLDFTFLRAPKRRRKLAALRKKSKAAPRKVASRATKKAPRKRRPAYAGARIVDFASNEKAGTIVVNTGERALYRIMGGGKAKRYLVAVGKEGFSWSGTARVGRKAVNPSWTPPAEMIERAPRFAKWAGGMPGGIPENPLGARAIYLYKGGRDTMFRIHGTNAPGSIGSAASSGCIRMLNHEVVDLYNMTRNGTKVVVR